MSILNKEKTLNLLVPSPNLLIETENARTGAAETLDAKARRGAITDVRPAKARAAVEAKRRARVADMTTSCVFFWRKGRATTVEVGRDFGVNLFSWQTGNFFFDVFGLGTKSK